ncbi:MAG: imidazoleglycerol-phosphate dehydratase [Candidatus Vidania fulgoroideorum]
MKKKIFKINRKTKETKIFSKINLSKKNKISSINTKIDFFDHLIEQFCFHGNFYLNLICKGNTKIDNHHIIEDTGIVLGKLFKKIFKNVKYKRYSFFKLIMEESITEIIIDISQRPYLNLKIKKKNDKDFIIEDVIEFFKSFSNNALINIHIYNKGENLHHRIESIFKCFGKVINNCLDLKENKIKSTK